jgi:uncharacterized membrane protein
LGLVTPDPLEGDPPSADPVVQRRARIARMAKLGKRIGYLALLVAIVGFAVGVISGFSPEVVRVIVVGLFVMCIVLPVPIVLGYGVRAAEREDRGR